MIHEMIWKIENDLTMNLLFDNYTFDVNHIIHICNQKYTLIKDTIHYVYFGGIMCQLRTNDQVVFYDFKTPFLDFLNNNIIESRESKIVKDLVNETNLFICNYLRNKGISASYEFNINFKK